MRVDKDLPSDDLPCEEPVETERMPADNDEQQPSVRNTISSMMELLTDRSDSSCRKRCCDSSVRL